MFFCELPVSLTYFLIDLGIILGPLLFTGDPRFTYYRNLPPLGCSILIVGGAYVGWDMLATQWDEWSFNPRYVSGITVVNLPLEEMLFFVTVPYACLFIYEAVLLKSKKEGWDITVGPILAAFAILVAGSAAYWNQGYTAKALGSCALFVLFALWLDRPLLQSRSYWLWLGICQLPFLLVNSILTALPVVQYNPEAIWGARFFTIPLEDFFYNYSLLSFYLLVYRLVKRKKTRF